jgi:hypothetical protein
MPFPMSKTDILEQISATHLLLEVHFSALSDAQMVQPGINGEWAVKDLLAHITWWEQHLLRRLRTGREDLYQEVTSMQAVTDQVNHEIFVANQSRSLADILEDFHASYQQVLAAVEALPEEALAQAEIYDAIAWDTFQHYPEHTAMLRSWIENGSET